MKSQQRQSFLDHIEAKAQAQPPVACWSEQHCARQQEELASKRSSYERWISTRDNHS